MSAPRASAAASYPPIHHPRPSDEPGFDRSCQTIRPLAQSAGCTTTACLLSTMFKTDCLNKSLLDLLTTIWLKVGTCTKLVCRPATRSYGWEPFYCSNLSAIGHPTTRGLAEVRYTEVECSFLVNTADCGRNRSVDSSSNNPFLFCLLTLPYSALQLIFQSPRPSLTSVSSIATSAKAFKGRSK